MPYCRFSEERSKAQGGGIGASGFGIWVAGRCRVAYEASDHYWGLLKELI